MRLRTRLILPIALFCVLAGVAGADVKKRWELDFKHDRPEHYTFTSPLGKASNFWYLTYTVTNNTPQVCPLIVDVALHVDKRNYQQPGFYPVEEAAIIAHADGLEGYSLGIQKEIIEDFKKRHKYLTKSDLRKVPVLQPGESVHCLAMFEDKAYRYNDVEVLVSGLVDPVTFKFEHREEGAGTEKSPIQLRYENRVFRLTYERDGDQFRSFARGLNLVKHDWIVVGVNPAVTKEDVAELALALTHEDPLVRRVALDLLARYTTAARKDIDLLSEDPKNKVTALQNAKAALAALGGIQNVAQKSPAALIELSTQLKSRIPPIDQKLVDLKAGAELSSDQIKEYADLLKIVIVKAQENKCPTPGASIAILTRAEPTSQNIYDWVCGYMDPSTKILYHGIQQWEAFLDDLVAANQQGGFNFVDALFESLNSDDDTVRDIAISILKDIATDDRMIFDVAAYDPKKPLDEQEAGVKDAVRRWNEWWSRNRDHSYWNPTTRSFEPIKK